MRIVIKTYLPLSFTDNSFAFTCKTSKHEHQEIPFSDIYVITDLAFMWKFVKVLLSYLNLAVSGSISSNSLTGERGTLAENFSERCGNDGLSG